MHYSNYFNCEFFFILLSVSEEEINEASKTINEPPEAKAADSLDRVIDSPRYVPNGHQSKSF